MTEDSSGPMAGTATLVTGGTGGIGAPEVEGVTGRYFAHRRPKTSNKASYDTTAAARLWDASARLICSGQETQGLALPRPGRVTRAAK